MTRSYDSGLEWAPLVDGQADLRFHAVQVPAPLMASAGPTTRVSLRQSWTSPEWGKDDFSAWAMPLVGKLVQSGRFKYRSLPIHKGEMYQMLEAVLFMPSARPEVLLAMPDALPAENLLLGDQQGRKQAGVRQWLAAHHSWHVPALLQVCDTTPDPAACHTARDKALRINNVVLMTRLIPDRDDLVLVTDGQVQALGKSRQFSAGDKRFELVPVASEPGLLELRALR